MFAKYLKIPWLCVRWSSLEDILPRETWRVREVGDGLSLLPATGFFMVYPQMTGREHVCFSALVALLNRF